MGAFVPLACSKLRIALGENTWSHSAKLEALSNYSIWKFRIKSVFQRDDCWELIEPVTDGLIIP